MTLNLKKKVSSDLHKEFFICLREENFCIIIFHRIFFLCRNILADWWLNTKSTKFDAHSVSAFILDPIKVIKHKSNGGVRKEYQAIFCSLTTFPFTITTAPLASICCSTRASCFSLCTSAKSWDILIPMRVLVE